MDDPPRPPFIFRATAPTAEDVDRVVGWSSGAPFTYAPVGATRGPLPAGWDHDEVREGIGHGAEVARRAEDALRRWTMFDLGWVRPHHTDVPQIEGATMAFTARTYGVYTINVCRVVYRIDDDDGVVRRAGFAYGTLPGHVLSGEEQFELRWDRRSDEVTFGIRKFSRPNLLLVRLVGPALIRPLQRRFSVDAIARLAAVAR
ncbi:MAG: DUF1990 domain-containing protein [Myxococcota bacterium]